MIVIVGNKNSSLPRFLHEPCNYGAGMARAFSTLGRAYRKCLSSSWTDSCEATKQQSVSCQLNSVARSEGSKCHLAVSGCFVVPEKCSSPNDLLSVNDLDGFLVFFVDISERV